MNTFYPTDFTPEVLADVAAERVRQHEKWGPQHHPDVIELSALSLPGMSAMSRAWYEKQANQWRDANDLRAKRGSEFAAWDGILLEEVFEALAEADPERLRAELIQAAAVCTAWVEDILSREGG